MDYRCYYCEVSSNSLVKIRSHLLSTHSGKPLKFRQLSLSEKTGVKILITKQFRKPETGVPEKKELCNQEQSEEQAFQKVWPQAARRLKDQGLLSMWIQFHSLIANGTFPLCNIALLLLLDVVTFYSSKSTSQMKYHEATKTFWRTAYKLFGGKLLRFMGGPKGQGQVVGGSADCANACVPTEAKVNFVVPSIRSLGQTENAQNIEPGIMHPCIETLSQTTSTIKISFDSKKINSCLTDNHGDEDLFNNEQTPTLEDTKLRLDKETKMLEETQNKFEHSSLSPSELHSAVNVISCRIRDLRQMAVMKTEGLKKFKELGKPDWRASKYSFVISSIQSHLFQISDTVNRCLEVNDRLCHQSAIMQGSLYRTGPFLRFEDQGNFVCIPESSEGDFDKIEVTSQRERCILKQRSPAWFEVRKSAKVTGSSAHRALGLNTMKEQQKHISSLKGDTDTGISTLSDFSQQAIQHGVENESHALATLVGKVMPAFLPSMVYVEEGCVVLKDGGKPFVVVSPDGSIRKDPHHHAQLAVEVKCPFMEKRYTTQVHYELPPYYVVQVILEMSALDCKELIFLSYTDASSCVFRVTFSEDLCREIIKELKALYGGDTLPKITRFRQEAKDLKEKIKEYARQNVQFMCELPSIKGKTCTHDQVSGRPHFQLHEAAENGSSEQVPDFEGTLLMAKQVICEAFKLCRRRATELIVFMGSDLDRLANFGCGHAVPIAYGLHGPSLKIEVVRKMLQQVMHATEEKGLAPLCFSSDGQFINVMTKDFSNTPLTLLQVQKEHWQNVNKMSKAQLLVFFRDLNQGNAVALDVTPEGRRVISLPNGEVSFSSVLLKKRHTRLLKVCPKPKEVTTNLDEDNEEMSVQAQALLPVDLSEKVDKDTYSEIMHVVTSLLKEEQIQNTPADKETEESEETVRDPTTPTDARPVLHNQTHQPTTSQGTSENLPVPDTGKESHPPVCLEHKHFAAMLLALKWETKTVNEMQEIFTSSDSIAKHLRKDELKLCCSILKSSLPTEFKALRISCSKREMVSSIAKTLGLQEPAYPVRKGKRCAPSLKDLAFRAVKTLPKTVLSAVYAEITFPAEESTWRATFPFSKTSNIDGDEITWFSYPLVRTSISGHQLPLFGVCDSHHILTNLRIKVCSSGMPARGIRREAWVKVAKEAKQNKAGLSTAHVEDLIDRQSNAFAQLTFSENVEKEMRKNGDLHEAEFCRLVRNWYASDDDAGIQCQERQKRRLAMRSWLVQTYNPAYFPPPTGYICDIPVVTFEALMTNVERKMQLYAFVKSYNPRAISTLDSENFFSLLGDLAPGGKGLAIRPADIPRAMSTASDIAKLHTDPHRPFHLHTSRAPVYPRHLLSPSDSPPDHQDRQMNDMSSITLSDHHFDNPERAGRKRKRKSGSLSGPTQPSKGARGVRQFHRVDETKILPTVRLGIYQENID